MARHLKLSGLWRQVLVFHDATDSLLARAASPVVIIMMLLTVADVSARYVFAKPFPGTYEIMCLMLAAVVFLPFAYMQRTGSQITITILRDRLPAKLRDTLNLVWLISSLFGLILLAWQSALATIEAVRLHDVTIGVIAVPTAPSRGLITLGCSFLSIRLFRQVVEGICKIKKD